MLDDLRAYYKRHGISAEHFDCPHGRSSPGSCRSISRDFVTAREAFVGSEYEKGTLPRVLFVSIDASSDSPGREPSKRTLKYMRFYEENGKSHPDGCDPERLPKNFHWYRTHEFAFGLLEPVAKRKRVAPFQFRDIHKYFAHTNSAKCKDAARKAGQGPPLVFNNCRKFIAPEVELLRPDVLVTQGDWGHRSIAGSFPVIERLVCQRMPGYDCEILNVANRPVLRFALYHPRNFGMFNRQRREAHRWYFAVADAFFRGGARAAASLACEA